jgi:hypothetical protein
MNTTHRFLSGLVSSLLFAVGFSRLAARFDPLTRQVTVDGAVNQSAADTSVNCWASVNQSAADTSVNCWGETQES